MVITAASAYDETMADQKVSKASVDYRPAPMGAMKRCGTCSMRTATGCSHVLGRISDGDVCDDWAPVRTS